MSMILSQLKVRIGWPTFPFGVLLALTAHLLWAMMPVSTPGPRPDPGNAQLTFWTEDQGTLPWTPTLFSLPSGMGFSGVIPRERDRLVVPDITSRLDLRPRVEIRPLALLPELTASPEPFTPRFLPLSTRSWEIPAPTVSPRFDWEFQLRDRLTDAPLAFQSLRKPVVPEPAGTVRVTGVMRFNAHGQVSHLILDPPGPDGAMRREILRNLRLVQIQTPGTPVETRFELSLLPVTVRP